MKKYYVYVFLDKSKPGNFEYGDLKFDFEPFYIGKVLEIEFTHLLWIEKVLSKLIKLKRYRNPVVKL